MSRLLNVGCGSVFHPQWVNLDAVPAAPEVVAHDLRRKLPFADATFDAVYASHVLEHLTPDAGMKLLNECRRVLKPGGVARAVVPDLETIVRLYLQSLEGALAGDSEAHERYDWMTLELYDQAVRSHPGGAMGAYLRDSVRGRQAEFVLGRAGDEVQAAQPRKADAMRRLRKLLPAVRRMAAGACAFLALGKEGREALREGLFRRSGEVHQWMYDRFSLKRALETAGFREVRVCAADESAIPGFSSYGLETRDGRPRKPDSLYVEARKLDGR